MNKKTKSALLKIFIFFLFIWGCEEFLRRKIGGFAGNYPFVESWELYAREADVIKAIEAVKKENPDLVPLNDTAYKSSYWYYIDFYYPETKEIVQTWTRESLDSTTTTIAFVGLLNLTDKEDRLINRDFWYVANKIEIGKFRKRILEKIKSKLYDK
jgi:hypothetical protein